MKKAELLEKLARLDDDADITIIDTEQNNAWDIIEVRTCEDNASEYKNKYADLVINI